MTAGTLSLTLDESASDGITAAEPVEDSVGLTYTPYTFTLTNNGSLNSSYTIYLDDDTLDTGQTRVDSQYIKCDLVKNDVDKNP